MALQIETNPVDKSAGTKRPRNIEIRLPGQSDTPSASERMFFTEQLAVLLDTGESLYGCLLYTSPSPRDVV